VTASSEAEAWQIARYFLIPKNKIHVVPYGVDEIYESASAKTFTDKFKLKDFALTVGRIEPRKNQLSLIRAMKGSGLNLVIIGNPVSHHSPYYEQCRKEAGSNVYFLGGFPLDSDIIRSAYAACSVFVLPTWFETPGLAALEAGLAGAHLVVTREGSTREYFGNHAEYVNPADRDDIRIKIKLAAQKPKTNALREHIKQNFTWHVTAAKTLKLYESINEKPLKISN
jgi:glycosyltransferase involved in cell wall biosynthesis